MNEWMNENIQTTQNFIGKIKSKFGLNLSNTNFKQIPAEFERLENLTSLNISNNSLEKLPVEIGSNFFLSFFSFLFFSFLFFSFQ